MFKIIGRIALTMGGLLAGAGLVTPAAAAAPVAFMFEGQCADCYNGAGIARAELLLRNYTVGTPIASDQFVLFHYDGTDLLPAYTIAGGGLAFISGSIASTAAAPGDLILQDVLASHIFVSDASGRWSTGLPVEILDMGTNGTFRMVDATGIVAVPEFASWAMLVMGFGVIGVASRARLRRSEERFTRHVRRIAAGEA